MTDGGQEPPSTDDGFPIVGLGASAGGLQALQEFFDKLPPDTGLAFIVVTHQPPEHVSLLPSILGKHTAMPVVEVADTVAVEKNHIYTSSPGTYLTITNRVLNAAKAEPNTHVHLPVDYFFRTLASDQKDRAIGIVLSGTGTDGALGLKEIKAMSGMTMAQEEASARFSGMPHTAIATDMVDYVLPAGELPPVLLAYTRGIASADIRPTDEPYMTDSLQQILLILRDHTGHDFSAYKKSTIRRRIMRRMGLLHISDVEQYVQLIRGQPDELDHLFKELLISVTSFFRDPEAFDALRDQALPALLSSRPDDHVFRAWVPGCATGEEAYSIAMVLREAMDRTKHRGTPQIFATDLDPDAVQIARAGAYSTALERDISPARIERFLTRDDGTFRVQQDIRDWLIFAQHDLAQEPPLTKLDLVSCRNLLIYLDVQLQQRLLSMFHYALRPEGILFIGSSESLGGLQHLFDAVDRKWKIFTRRETSSSLNAVELPSITSVGPSSIQGRTVAGRKPSDRSLAQLAGQLLLEELVPPTVIIHEHGDILHIHGRTGMYLEPTPGPQRRINIFDMAREGLQPHLVAAIHQATRLNDEVTYQRLPVKTNGATVLVDLRVKPLSRPEQFRGLLLVTFQPSHVDEDEGTLDPDRDTGISQESAQISRLERALQLARENYQGVIEELESSNEELQSSNEELQSTNEEIETAKEEMQSLNEELQTVNTELQEKIEQLSRVNDDLQNLLDGTDIATIFLDGKLQIQRFTERAKRIIRVIATDVGRPIDDIVPRLHYGHLAADAREVLHTLVPKEIEVQAHDGSWYLMRILPYRTAENVIDGLIITFVDITTVKRLQESERQLQAMLQNSRTSVFGQDTSLRFTWAFGSIFGRAPHQVLGKKDAEILGPDESESMISIKQRVLDTGAAVREEIVATIDGEPRTYDVHVVPVRTHDGTLSGFTCIQTDITVWAPSGGDADE